MTTRQDIAVFAERFLVDARGKVAEASLEALRTRRRSFSWLNLASAGLTINRLLHDLRMTFDRIPRTGHLGNWGISATTGSLDYNFVLCDQAAVATPLIFDLNQTETYDLRAGDTIYLPGSLVSDGRRQPLNLYAFDGSGFSPVSSVTPRFVPFVMTPDTDGHLVPLTVFHRRRLAAMASWTPAYQSSVLTSKREQTRDFLSNVVDRILHADRAPRFWETLSDRTVTRGGEVRRKRSSAQKGVVQIGHETLSSPSAVVDRLMMPLDIAAGGELEKELRAAPDELPLLSNHAVYALLVNALPMIELGGVGEMSVQAHLQWGAIGLAGVPPVQPSYFDDNKRRVRSLFDLLAESRGAAQRNYLFVVLPSPPFLLFPRTDAPSDSAVLRDICGALIARRSDRHSLDMLGECEALVRHIAGPPSHSRLSRYFAMRFKHFRSPLHGIAGLQPSDVTMCDSVMKLSLAEASLLTAALWRHFSGGEV